jgi:hypothetical protein
LFVSTATVFFILRLGPGHSALYTSARNMELIKVDLPSPDSPAKIRETLTLRHLEEIERIERYISRKIKNNLADVSRKLKS